MQAFLFAVTGAKPMTWATGQVAHTVFPMPTRMNSMMMNMEQFIEPRAT